MGANTSILRGFRYDKVSTIFNILHTRRIVKPNFSFVQANKFKKCVQHWLEGLEIVQCHSVLSATNV